jgi:hypothetical protein
MTGSADFWVVDQRGPDSRTPARSTRGGEPDSQGDAHLAHRSLRQRPPAASDATAPIIGDVDDVQKLSLRSHPRGPPAGLSWAEGVLGTHRSKAGATVALLPAVVPAARSDYRRYELDRLLSRLASSAAESSSRHPQARAEMRATGETPIPWEQVKADLGLE